MALFDDVGMVQASSACEMDDLYDCQSSEQLVGRPVGRRADPRAERRDRLGRSRVVPLAGRGATRPVSQGCSASAPLGSRRAGTTVKLRRREKLVIQQGELWELEQGFVKALIWDEQGCVLTLGLWGPGDSVGLPLGEISPYEILCVSPVQAKCHYLPHGYPYDFLWEQAQQSQMLLSLFRCRCLENRLLDALWWLARRFGEPGSGGMFTGITLTHQELADLVGSTRVTITRILGQLEDSGKLERVNRQFLLKQTPGRFHSRGRCG